MLNMDACFKDDFVSLYNCRCEEGLDTLEDNSVDAIITDPPYGIAFMGKKWDYDVPSVSVWEKCFRVLKPGGHLLSFAGTKTQHRMAVNIEDAGFEIRDMIAWVYGSGFPKSLDVSKAIDKHLGEAGTFGEPKSEAHAGWISRGKMRGDGGHEGYQRPWMKDEVSVQNNARKYIPGSNAATTYTGWGTALKPAMEPITVARKPFSATVASNVIEWGTGAINIDACRVGVETRRYKGSGAQPHKLNAHDKGDTGIGYMDGSGKDLVFEVTGRWPANLIHDGSDEVLAAFPNAPGQLADASHNAPSQKTSNVYGKMNREGERTADARYADRGSTNFAALPGARRSDSGSAARFFYCAKASKKERGEGNTHPTVKPLELMKYLVRLVTPKGGLILDPFAGSCTTLIAASSQGFRAVGFETDKEYCKIGTARLDEGFFK